MTTASPPSPLRAALGSGARLALIAGGVVCALTLVNELTHEPIAANQQRARAAVLIELTGDPRVATLPPQHFDANHVELCDEGRSRYRLIRGAAPGYSGSIEFAIAVSREDDTILGVRVTHHTETPGLGDAIEADRSDWILELSNQPVHIATSERWAVIQDGGQFDALTGATITSRALLAGVRRALSSPLTEEERPCVPLT